MGIRCFVLEGIALFGAVELERGAGFVDLPGELCALGPGGLRQLDARRFGLALEVGALLLGVTSKIAPLLFGLAGELGTAELGLPGERSCGIPGLAHFSGGDGLHLGSLALGFGSHCSGFTLRGGTGFCSLCGDRTADRGRFAQCILGDRLGLGPGALEKLGRLGVRRVEDAHDCGMRIRDAFVGTLHCVSAQLGDLGLHPTPQLLGIDIGLADEPGRLLLGHAQGVLEFRAKTAVGRAAGLLDLCLEIVDSGVKPLELFGGFGLVTVGLDQLATKILDRSVHLVAVVPAHRSGEGLVVSGQAVSS